MRAIWAIAVLFLFLCGCAAAADSEDGQGEAFEFVGAVRYVELEGGFYGIVADSGENYDPIELPESFMEDGLRVRVKARDAEASVGFHMWGKKIEILAIDRL